METVTVWLADDVSCEVDAELYTLAFSTHKDFQNPCRKLVEAYLESEFFATYNNGYPDMYTVDEPPLDFFSMVSVSTANWRKAVSSTYDL